MQKMLSSFRFLLLFILSVGLSKQLQASLDPVIERWGSSTATLGATLHIEDNQWAGIAGSGGSPSTFANAHCQNLVGLHFDPNDNTYLGSPFELLVSLTITYQDTNGNQSQASPKLIINYDPAGKTTYRAKNYYPFEEGYYVDINITDIRLNNVQISSLPSYAYLEASIEVERYWFFDRLTAGSGLTVSPATMTNHAGYIDIVWNGDPTAEEYDLEWIYVDDYDLTSGNYIASSQLEYDFNRQATRVTLSNDYYRLSHLFGHGYVVFRVRPVGRDINDPLQRQPGTWSIPVLDTIGNLTGNYCFISEAHRDSINWQVQLSFIEEGKKKEVISYHDGTLRGRQTVSRVDADSNAVVAEVYYDFEGRAAVQALPTPIPQSTINYYPNFNLSQQNPGQAFSWEDFDMDDTTSSACSLNTFPMDTTAGTARYYSSQNPDQEGHQAYVPHAFGFPFSRVEYMPDATGRVRRQGGVGPTYQLGSGHENKYFYGEPYQEELNRLFGTEVGYAIRYKQNMVIDPNGQVSISYLDAHGRTIATALAGDAPENVDQLAHNRGDSLFTVDLMAFNDSMQGSGWRVQKEHLVKSDGNHLFTYNLCESRVK